MTRKKGADPIAKHPQTVVLKFGSSVLSTPADLSTAVREIYRYVRRRTRVVAVVSAIGTTTDELQARIDRIDAAPNPAAVARLLETGELQSAALLELELSSWGITATTVTPDELKLRTEGPLLDADPISLDESVLERAFDRVDVIVVPGFCGRATLPDGTTTPSLLGRGGSDLSALFLARCLGATVCLLKDTEGIYLSDPNAPGACPDRFEKISWRDAIALQSPVVQSKTLEFAEQHRTEFDVAQVGRCHRTRVGRGPSRIVSPPARRFALRIAVLGHGNVGRETVEALRHRDDIEVTEVCVRRPEKHAALLTHTSVGNDPWCVVRGSSDVIVDLTGSPDARRWIPAALASGKHVVTADKQLIAEQGSELDRQAEEFGLCLRYSAAVGGGVPMLESVATLAPEKVHSLSGVLNGTTNYVLECWAAGMDVHAAIEEAQARGFAEADPTRDVSGADAAAKLRILARAAWGREPDALTVSGIDTLEGLRRRSSSTLALRQIARVTREGEQLIGRVALEWVTDPRLRALSGADNALIVDTARGSHCCRGRGAGGRPTSASVLADIDDVVEACKETKVCIER